jgi:hypothetical protein
MKEIYHTSAIRQFVFETESWLRCLAFISQETTHYKYRLAEMVMESDSYTDLQTAEKIQEMLLSEDIVISFLKTELVKHSNLMQRDAKGDEQLLDEAVKKQLSLRNDIRNAEQLFIHIKEAFSDYVNDHY